jgi:hypothetical protein
MTYASLQNRDDAYVQPTTVVQAARPARIGNAPGFGAILTNQPDKAAGRSPSELHRAHRQDAANATEFSFFDGR